MIERADLNELDRISVSVIMSTFREPERYLEQSIMSILNQTFNDFEFLIAIDDPDNETHIRIISEYAIRDKRIKFRVNERNLGQALSRNNLAKDAKGKYLAIMDADDISVPNRLERQYLYMETNRDIGILGSRAYKMDANGNVFGVMNIPLSEQCIRVYLQNGFMPIVHSSMFLKKEDFIKLEGYRDMIVEDFDFLYRALILGIRISNIDEILLKCRIYQSQNRISSTKCYFQYKSGKYTLLNKNRQFSKIEYDKFLKGKSSFTESISRNLYHFSKKCFETACNYKSKRNFFKLTLYLLLSLLSPHHLYDLYRLSKIKLLCKLKKIINEMD